MNPGEMALESTEALLAAAARTRDPADFGLVVERYRRLVFAYAYARTRSREEAEDLTQETFVRAYTGLDRMRSPERWEAWMMRILRNLCSDSARRRRVRRSEPIDPTLASAEPSPEMAAVEQAFRREIADAVDALSEKYRTPLLLHYSSRLTYQEIAVALGIPLTTVRGRLAGALLQLRRRLGDDVWL